MATKQVHSLRFPEGTAVRAYAMRDVNLERQIDRVPIIATAVDEEVVDADNNVTITGDAGEYLLLGVVNEVQEVTVDATSGDFNLTFNGQTTADVAFNVSAANLEAALVALSNIAAADVDVSGGPGDDGGTTPYLVTFRGVYAGSNVGQMTGDDGVDPLAGGAATVTISTTTQGAGSVLDSDGEMRWVAFRID